MGLAFILAISRPVITETNQTIDVMGIEIHGQTFEPIVTEAIVTAYSPDSASCWPFNDGKTSTGRDALRRGVAADPKRIPYGSIVEIEGIIYEVDDTGSAMKRAEEIHIDLRFPTHEEAVNFGVKKMKVRVWKKM